MKENKQRLTMLTRKAKQAAVTGGVMDDRIDADKIDKRLADEPRRSFNRLAVLDAVRAAVKECRGVEATDAKLRGGGHMEPAEIVAQADDTVRMIDELLARLQHAHPDLDCWVSEALNQTIGESLLSYREGPSGRDLYRLRAAFNAAGDKVKAYPTRPGPKETPWARQRDALAVALRQHSTPPLPVKAAPGLAADLLEVCGCRNPRGR